MNKPERDPRDIAVSRRREAENIARAAGEDAGFAKMIKYKKGEYFDSEGMEIPIGTQFTAHAVGWTKCWIKFRGGVVQDRKVYRMIDGAVVPPRENLDDRDERTWEKGINDKPADPWVLQYLLPLEDESGEVQIFVTSSFGGKRAVSDLCMAWGRRAAKGDNGQPIVLIHSVKMPTKKFGDVPRPYFKVVGWDSASPEQREVTPPETGSAGSKQDFDDEIPF
jgi:hypothetical protein